MENYKEKVAEITKNIDFENKIYEVNFDTDFGSITLELFPDVAPKHCSNIIALSKAGFFDNLTFHRIVPGFVIQGGCPSGTGTGGPGYNIDAEFNSMPHKQGTLSMARAQDPNSAGSQFFLCLEDTPFLDNQYTVFGKAKNQESLEVILKIGQVETGPGDRPLEDVKIKKATVFENDK